LVAGRGIGEEIGCVEARAVPEFVKVAVETIAAGFGDVVDLRGAVAA